MYLLQVGHNHILYLLIINSLFYSYISTTNTLRSKICRLRSVELSLYSSVALEKLGNRGACSKGILSTAYRVQLTLSTYVLQPTNIDDFSRQPKVLWLIFNLTSLKIIKVANDITHFSPCQLKNQLKNQLTRRK